MKVLQVHARYRGRGGEDTTVQNERGLLLGAGHEVGLFEGRNSYDPLVATRQLARSTWNTSAARRLSNVIDELLPDVVHVHNTWFALSPSVLAAATRKGVAVVMTLQNYRLVCVSANLFRDGAMCEDCVGRGPWPGVKHRCYHDSALTSSVLATSITVHRQIRSWRRWVDSFIAVSEFGVQRHVAGGVPRERIFVKDNFAPDPGARSAPPSASSEVLFVGRAEPEKGLVTLLASWAAARPARMRLAVVSSADTPGSVPDGVDFIGTMDPPRLIDRMRRARALIIPSEWPEGQPLVLLEALASGLPVIGSAIGGIEEVLRDHREPWLVPVGSRVRWRESIAGLADPEAVDRAGAASRLLYEQRFAPATALQNLERIYGAAIARRNRASARRRSAERGPGARRA